MKAVHVIAACAGIMTSGLAVASPTPTTVDFSHGAEGWIAGDLGTTTDPSLGNPAPSLHTVVDNFGVFFQNKSNGEFTGDYTSTPSVTVGLDVLTKSIKHFGSEISRDLYLTLTDFGDAAHGVPDATLFYDLGTLEANPHWKTLSVTIADTSATALPSGWCGFGGTSGLPDGRTFADVLANVDRIEFTTFEPGYAYFSVANDIAVDNIFIAPSPAGPAPEAATWAMMIAGFGMVGARMRQRLLRHGGRLHRRLHRAEDGRGHAPATPPSPGGIRHVFQAPG